MSLRVPALVKDSLLYDKQLTTRDWTLDDDSFLALMTLYNSMINNRYKPNITSQLLSCLQVDYTAMILFIDTNYII